MTRKICLSGLFRSPNTIFTNRSLSSSPFVPNHEPPDEEEIEHLQRVIDDSPRMTVLTGAGVSTESGLPDYRSREVGLFSRTTYRPITIQEFVEGEKRRQSYWARNFVAWNNFSNAQPNITHLTLAKWQKTGRISALVTQNVDQLHQKAGSFNVIELHGNSFTVGCMQCSYQIARKDYQLVLQEVNPNFNISSGVEIRPDGDIIIPQELVLSFKTSDCPSCGGLLKPKVVFFGENVAKDVVEQIYTHIKESDLLLVLGSSLEVFSGYRFVLHSMELGKRIVIINIGPTRADRLLNKEKNRGDWIVFLRKRVGEVLPLIKV